MVNVRLSYLTVVEISYHSEISQVLVALARAETASVLSVRWDAEAFRAVKSLGMILN